MKPSKTVRIAWIALFAALMHLLLPTVHAASSPGGFVTTICSTEGARVVPGAVFDDDHADHSASHKAAVAGCLLCAAGAHAGITPAPPLAVAAARHLSHVLTAAVQVDTAPLTMRVQFLSRAPPQA